jgi:hypothetical protein
MSYYGRFTGARFWGYFYGLFSRFLRFGLY